MRALTLLAAIFFLLALPGCGTNAPSGPKTHVEISIIEADLPGTGWQMTNTDKKGSLTVETWKNPDESMIYRVSSNPDEILDGTGVQFSEVDDYMALMFYPPSSQAVGASLHGRRGVRLEAVRPEPDAYHMIDYVVMAGFQQYYIGAGAKNSTWANGGQDTVDAIFESIQFKH